MFKRLKKMFGGDPQDVVNRSNLDVQRKELGDGGAVFFGEGTEEEYSEFMKEETGMKPWYDRLKNLDL